MQFLMHLTLHLVNKKGILADALFTSVNLTLGAN